MQANRGRDTTPEVLVRSLLHASGLRFRKHHRQLPDLRCAADIVFSKERVAVFIDGCWWHACPVHGRRPSTNGGYWSAKFERNRARDRRNDEVLRAAGWAQKRVRAVSGYEVSGPKRIRARRAWCRRTVSRPNARAAGDGDSPAAWRSLQRSETATCVGLVVWLVD